jgi:hypothetical protein
MKKIYINPQIDVIKIQTMQMLATSNSSLNLHPDEEENDINNLI